MFCVNSLTNQYDWIITLRSELSLAYDPIFSDEQVQDNRVEFTYIYIYTQLTLSQIFWRRSIPSLLNSKDKYIVVSEEDFNLERSSYRAGF